MRKLLALWVVIVMSANAAWADHIGLYRDATGTDCTLSTGFSTTATIIHKFTLGATGSRFKLVLPAGSSFFAISTPYGVAGFLPSDLSLSYGECLTGNFPLLNVVAIWSPGVASVMAADGFQTVMVTGCDATERSATGGSAHVGIPGDPCDPFDPIATEPTTWGKVKSLYR